MAILKPKPDAEGVVESHSTALKQFTSGFQCVSSCRILPLKDTFRISERVGTGAGS